MKKLAVLATCGLLAGCGVIYITPGVSEEVTQGGLKVRVVPLTAETAVVANRDAYIPRSLPEEIQSRIPPSTNASFDAPDSVLEPVARPDRVATRLPAQLPIEPYRIGVGDELLFASPASGSTVEELSGLLAAQNARQGYTVQDDGSVAIPNVGRVPVNGLTLEGAESALFEQLVDAGFEPAFSIEIAEFGSKRVSVGGAVANPQVLPIALTPLTLGDALLLSGGTPAGADTAVVRLYRAGQLYQVPADEVFTNQNIQSLRLTNGDSIYVDQTFNIEEARAYFEEQISLANLQRAERTAALDALRIQVNALDQQRAFVQTQLELGSLARDYVYLTGEVSNQARVALPFDGQSSLADVLFGEGGFETRSGNPGQIYVLRGSDVPSELAGLTAYHLDAENAANFLLATRLEMRPNDIVFIAEQPVVRWNRAISLVLPTIITTRIAAN